VNATAEIMRSYHGESGGGLASLVTKDHPVPHPGHHEALLRVRANSLNAPEFSETGNAFGKIVINQSERRPVS
jgi:hypothetical protein